MSLSSFQNCLFFQVILVASGYFFINASLTGVGTSALFTFWAIVIVVMLKSTKNLN